MRRALKLSASVLAGTLLLLSLLGAAVWVAGNTDAGRSLIERLTVRLTSGHVKLSDLGGSLPLQLTLRKLELSDGHGVWLTADDISLRWSPLKWLQRRIQVDDVRAKRVHVERAPISDKKGGGASIPHIEVGSCSVDAVELGAPLAGAPATLSLRGTLKLRSFEDADADVAVRRLDGEGEYTLRLHFDPGLIDGSLTAHEPASGPLENLLSLPGLGALSATLTVRGPRAAVRVDLALAAGDLLAGVHGGVDLIHRSADLQYSVESPAMSPRPRLAWSRVSLSGKWHGPLSAPTADGKLEAEGLQIPGNTHIRRLRSELAAGAGKLTVRTLVGGLEIPGPQPQILANDELTIDASLALDEASRPLELSAAHPVFKLRAHAETAAVGGAKRRATMTLTLPDVAPFAAMLGQDARGNATIDARLAYAGDQSTLALDADVGLTGGARWVSLVGPRLGLKMEAAIDAARIDIQNLHLVGNAFTAAASGSAARTPPAPGAGFIKELQARWQADVADLSGVSKDLAGDLRISGHLSGTPASLMGDAEIASRLSVRGSESGTVQASVRVRDLPNAPRVTLRGHGMIDGAPLQVDATLDRSASKVSRLTVRRAEWKSAQLDGDLTADAAFTRSHGQMRLQIGQLGDFNRLLGLSLAGGVDGRLAIAPAQGQGHTQVRLQVDGSNLAAGKFAGDVHLGGSGASDAVGLQLTARLPAFYGMPATVSAAGILNIESRELSVASLAVGYRGENFRLSSPARLSFAKGVNVDEFEIGARDALFNLKGQLAPTLEVAASLRNVKPALVDVFLPGLFATGAIEAYARLHGSLSSPAGAVRLEATNMHFADEAATGLPSLALHAQAQLAGDSALIDASLAAGAGSQLTVAGSASLKESGAFDMKIGGKLDASLINPFLEARGLHGTGQIAVDATITGNPGAAQVGGGITLRKGSYRDYARGVNLSDMEADIVGDEAGLLIKRFKATAVSGTVAMTGSFGLLQPGMPLDLKITAQNAQPVVSNIVTANLDADLHVSGTARQRIDVNGTVHVNRATIGIPNSLPPAVAVLDVRRRGRSAPAPNARQLIVGMDVVIQAPQEILVQGRGLDAEMGGEIRLSGTTDDLVVSGEFNRQRGIFILAGNRLNITQGRVGFDGAGLRKKIDPTLDFTAETTVGDTTATLRITGLADAPRFEFLSTPSLPQDELMARLFFGENAAQLTAIQYAQIAAALATLSGVGGGTLNPLAKLQKSLGLDRLTVGTNTTNTPTGPEKSGAAIEVGRYLTKRIYVEGKQTTTGTSQVQVDVDLTKHLKLQTRLGNGATITQGTTPENDPGSSVGLSYQFEY